MTEDLLISVAGAILMVSMYMLGRKHERHESYIRQVIREDTDD